MIVLSLPRHFIFYAMNDQSVTLQTESVTAENENVTALTGHDDSINDTHNGNMKQLKKRKKEIPPTPPKEKNKIKTLTHTYARANLQTL